MIGYSQEWMQEKDDIIMEEMKKRIPEVAMDANRPKYHIVSPASSLIDTWGGFYHKGYYHVFYDINADFDPGRYGGYFGHVRSKDLLHWEHLPLALAPEKEKDELQLNDGCIALDGAGRPIMYYTSVFFDPKRHREQVAVRGDDDLIRWERLDDVPRITMENHGGPWYHPGWSDPVIFREGGRTFMIISKCVTKDGHNQIPIYEAVDDTLLAWEYKGIFMEDTGEVINFFKMNGKWVLIYCPYEKPVYFVGDFDLETLQFTPEKTDILCYGYISQGHLTNVSRGLYATTVIEAPEDRKILFGWVSGFDDPEPEGWAGAIGIPRDVFLDDQKRGGMRPVPELKQLRRGMQSIAPEGGSYSCGNAFELVLAAEGQGEVKIDINGTTLQLNSEVFRLRDITVEADKYDGFQDLHLYVDVSTAELFINGGVCSITRCIPTLSEKVDIKVERSGCYIKEGFLYNLGE